MDRDIEEIRAFELKVGDIIAVILDEYNLLTFMIRNIKIEKNLCVIETSNDMKLRYPLGKVVYKLV
jgi:superfamily I DNA and RNA helicase